jgi:hypothetical protein
MWLNSLCAGGLGDENADVAVFRFTLGIPGFDDSRIPQVVGAMVAAAVAVNHVLGVQPTPPAQVRGHATRLPPSCALPQQLGLSGAWSKQLACLLAVSIA